jgi:hypothetical protein
MKTSTIVGIAIGAGIPAVLILIGLIAYIIKFCMKRCRRRPWDEITSLPKDSDSVNVLRKVRRTKKSSTNDREPLFESSNSHTVDVSDAHIAIPIDEHDLPSSQREVERTRQHEHTLVQIQRGRLNRLKEEGNRLRSMVPVHEQEGQLRRAIEEAQREFDKSV